MITTLYRPPALQCGGVNALQPLNRDCNVVEPGTCEPTAPLPIGIWFDGMSLLWDKDGRVAAFGMDILTDARIQTDIPERWDPEMETQLVDEDVWSASVSNMMGFETIPAGIANEYWDHYKFFMSPPRMFAASAAMIYSTTTGQPHSFYTRHDEPVRLGLAARVISGELSKILSGESLDSGYDALIVMPAYPSFLTLAPVTLQVLRQDTGELLGTVSASLTLLTEMYGFGVTITGAMDEFSGSDVKFSIAPSELNALVPDFTALGLNLFDRVFTKYIPTDSN